MGYSGKFCPMLADHDEESNLPMMLYCVLWICGRKRMYSGPILKVKRILGGVHRARRMVQATIMVEVGRGLKTWQIRHNISHLVTGRQHTRILISRLYEMPDIQTNGGSGR
jgi:hypothetical protein